MENQIYLNQNISRSSNAARGFSRKYFLKWLNDAVKRDMDVVAALFGLILLLPLFLVIGILIKRDSPGPILYRGKRAGRGGSTFDILKFRTMYERPSSYEGTKVTAVNDDRITRMGRWLRDTKVNELPQLWNVLIGDMSLVGPRPEDPDIAATWSEEARKEILSVRPGITSPSSVIYRHEEKLLNTKDVMATYMKSILPSKIRLDQLYVRNRSFWLDLDVIFWTLLVLWPGLSEYQPPEDYLFWGPVYRLFRRYVYWFLVDTVIAIFAFEAVGLFRESLERFFSMEGAEIVVILSFALVFNLTGALMGINRIAWSKAIFADVFDMIPALVIATSVTLLVDSLLGYLPAGLILLSSAFAFAGIVVARYHTPLITSVISRILRARVGGLSAREKVLIIGSGRAGQFAARMLSHREGAGAYYVVGFIDDDYFKTGERIQGTRVLGGRKDIPALVARHDVGIIIFAIHNIDPKDRDEILENCHKTQASVFMLPDFLGALKNITSISKDHRITVEGNSYAIDLSHTDRRPFFAEEVFGRDFFMKPAEQIFRISQEARSHLTAIVAEVHQLDQLLNCPDSAQADGFLLKVAAQCHRVLRNIDLIGLCDGGKFAILLSDHKAIPAKIIINRLSSYIEDSCFEDGDRKVQVKLNIGVANRDEGTSSLITLLDRAVADLIGARQARETLTMDLKNNMLQESNLYGDIANP